MLSTKQKALNLCISKLNELKQNLIQEGFNLPVDVGVLKDTDCIHPEMIINDGEYIVQYCYDVDLYCLSVRTSSSSRCFISIGIISDLPLIAFLISITIYNKLFSRRTSIDYDGESNSKGFNYDGESNSKGFNYDTIIVDDIVSLNTHQLYYNEQFKHSTEVTENNKA